MIDNVIDQLFIVLGINSDGLDNDIAQIENKLVDGLGKIAGTVVAPLAAMFSTAAIGALFNDILQEADAIGKAADSMSVAVEELHAWQEAAKGAGGSAEGLNSSVANLSRNLADIAVKGTSEMSPFFNQLKISAHDASGKIRDSFDVLEEIAAKIEGMDKHKSSGLLQSMGFDQGTIQLIQSGTKNIKEAIRAQKEIGVYTKADAEAAAEYNDALDKLNRTIKMAIMPVVIMFAKVLTKVADTAAKGVMLIKEHIEAFIPILAVLAMILISKVVPAIVSMGIAFLASPVGIITAALLGLGLIIEDLIVWLDGGESAFEEFWESLFGSVEEAKKVFEDIASSFWQIVDLLSPVFNTLLEGLKQGSGPMQEAFKSMLEVVLASIAFIVKAIDGLLEAIVYLLSGTDENLGRVLQKWESFRDSVLALIISLMKAVINFWEFLKPIFNGIGIVGKAIFKTVTGDNNNPELALGNNAGVVDNRKTENTMTQEVHIHTKDDPASISSAVTEASKKGWPITADPANVGVRE